MDPRPAPQAGESSGGHQSHARQGGKERRQVKKNGEYHDVDRAAAAGPWPGPVVGAALKRDFASGGGAPRKGGMRMARACLEKRYGRLSSGGAWRFSAEHACWCDRGNQGRRPDQRFENEVYLMGTKKAPHGRPSMVDHGGGPRKCRPRDAGSRRSPGHPARVRPYRTIRNAGRHRSSDIPDSPWRGESTRPDAQRGQVPATRSPHGRDRAWG